MRLVCLLLLISSACSGQDITVDDGTPLREGEGFLAAVPSYLAVVKSGVRHSGDSWVGSGAFLTDKLVLTCYHNIRGVNTKTHTLKIHTTSGVVYNDCKVVHTNPKYDLALILIMEKITEYHTVIHVKNDVGPMAFVYSMGFNPTQNAICKYKGKPTGKRYGERGVRGPVYLGTTATCVQGMSGGPLLDQHGKLVGVLSSSDGKESLATMLTRVHEFLDTYRGPTGSFSVPLFP